MIRWIAGFGLERRWNPAANYVWVLVVQLKACAVFRDTGVSTDWGNSYVVRVGYGMKSDTPTPWSHIAWLLLQDIRKPMFWEGRYSSFLQQTQLICLSVSVVGNPRSRFICEFAIVLLLVTPGHHRGTLALQSTPRCYAGTLRVQ
jgi:hypothetical protein